MVSVIIQLATSSSSVQGRILLSLPDVISVISSGGSALGLQSILAPQIWRYSISCISLITVIYIHSKDSKEAAKFGKILNLFTNIIKTKIRLRDPYNLFNFLSNSPCRPPPSGPNKNEAIKKAAWKSEKKNNFGKEPTQNLFFLLNRGTFLAHENSITEKTKNELNRYKPSVVVSL